MAAAVAAVLVICVPEALGAVVGLARPGQSTNTTTTSSTKHITTTERVDLEDAPAPECDFPGAPPTLVSETAVDLEPTITITETIGPATILIGDLDAGGTPFEVPSGTNNYDVLTTYEQVVTQYFQATAAGLTCEVVAAARFTG